MQTSGEVFDPKYYFFDPETSLVYRKEQFEDEQLPTELIVRDRRYSRKQIEDLCRASEYDRCGFATSGLATGRRT